MNDINQFLERPDTYGLRAGRVERIDTHISVVFLAGTRAYKLKRAVRFPYLDYSTLELRRRACLREVELNRRTAPFLYRAAVAVTKEPDGRLALGGNGEPVEWLVEMVRFDDDALLDKLALDGRLEVQTVARLAHRVGIFHEQARPRRDHGGARAMALIVSDNLDEMLADDSSTLPAEQCRALHDASMAAIARHALLLDARRVHGLVRQCHGDLHLHNVFLHDGEPVPFDAIEFNDELACTDVMYDLAFLLMDLLHRDLPTHANAALNAWLEVRADLASLALLPLFLSCRAAVRAKVALAQARARPQAEAAGAIRKEGAAYLAFAGGLLAPPPPRLVAVGGFSGSGKSTLAAALAPAIGPPPGAVVVRTDAIRKRLFGRDPLEPLPPAAYEPDVTAQVYARALHQAEASLGAGHAAILDAVFADPRHREAAARVASGAGVPFTGVWLDVPAERAAERLGSRKGDASDATPAVLRMQLARGAGEVRWLRIDGSGSVEDVARAVQRVL